MNILLEVQIYTKKYLRLKNSTLGEQKVLDNNLNSKNMVSIVGFANPPLAHNP